MINKHKDEPLHIVEYQIDLIVILHSTHVQTRQLWNQYFVYFFAWKLSISELNKCHSLSKVAWNYLLDRVRPQYFQVN